MLRILKSFSAHYTMMIGVAFFLFAANENCSAQILTYTTDTTGTPNNVDANATGTALARVNGANRPGSICSMGYCSANYSAGTTYSSSLPAVEVTVTPHSGYTLNVTGFNADLRRSGTGPASLMWAYSTDGGSSWTPQGTAQTNPSASCGSGSTLTWTTAFAVAAPNTLTFRIYGYSASTVSGSEQILNLVINGAVTSAGSCAIPTNLTQTNIADNSATLNWAPAPAATSYNVRYRQTGSVNWTTATSNTNSVSISGLTSGTGYEFQVQTVCSGISAFSASSDFTTSGLPITDFIKIYFNRPVDTALSTTQAAVYLDNTLADTLVAYINRAKYSIDVAMYDFSQSTTMTPVVNAINNAYTSGIKVRWIYDGSQDNSALPNLNSGIHTLGSPTGGEYGIMHNKFMLVDAGSSTSTDPLVWTGSTNWSKTQMDSDVDNAIIIQDKGLAQAYTIEFNQMWGDTGLTPNNSNSKFGPHKKDITPHSFTIGGRSVECFFSPSDTADNHLVSAINSANSQLYFGIYTMTETTAANAIVLRSNAGVSVAGIVDQFSIGSSGYNILQAGLGNKMETYAQNSSLYHSKFLVVDPCDLSSDPLVETGSYNWSVAANTTNDENMLIIHDATIANIYYQAFYRNFIDFHGTLSPCAVTAGIEDLNADKEVKIYPNPLSAGNWQVEVAPEFVGSEYQLFDTQGKLIYEGRIKDLKSEISPNAVSGMYVLRINNAKDSITKKLIRF